MYTKTKLNIQPSTSTVSDTAIPLLYDSGILYDDVEAYYDTWYPASSSPFLQADNVTVEARQKITLAVTTNEQPVVKVV